jgi:general secretion pathway protein A
MYEAFFGLHERPFDLAPNPRFLYLTPRQREALGNLRYGLSTERGLTLLLGDAGTGKTTLIQAVLADLDRTGVDCVLLNNPTLTRNEFCEFVARGFGLDAEASSSKTRFLAALSERLQRNHKEGRISALILDEAQSLPYELLEEVRLLTNIETPTHKLLNVVLAGQPELADRLNERSLRQLKQRISLRCELGAFDVADTAAYIAGRLRIAGGSPAQIFSREAVTAVYEASHGIPRTINVICDNALIGGFAAQVKPVPKTVVDEVVRDFDLRISQGIAFSPEPAEPGSHTSDSRMRMVAPAQPRTYRESGADGLTTLGLSKQSSFF